MVKFALCYSTAANQNIEDDLHASPSSISLSLSLFILFQGVVPLLWSAVSEINGRKVRGCFCIDVTRSLIALAGRLLTVICHIHIGICHCGYFKVYWTLNWHEGYSSSWVDISFSTFSLHGASDVWVLTRSSAVIAIGTGTLADLYEPAERGSKIGLYYSAPLLGLSLGPILGGSLTQGFHWRAVFWFLVIFAGLNFFSFLVFFNDTFRRERSSAYQAVMKRRSHEHGQITGHLTVVEKQGDDWAPSKADNNHLAIEAPPLMNIKLSLTDVNPFPPLLLILKRWNNLAILFPSGAPPAFPFGVIAATTSFIRHRIHRPFICVQFQHHVHMCSDNV
jgi:MFS family permease